jgi:hypothetical protein
MTLIIMALDITKLSAVITECHYAELRMLSSVYAEFHSCQVSFMLSGIHAECHSC